MNCHSIISIYQCLPTYAHMHACVHKSLFIHMHKCIYTYAHTFIFHEKHAYVYAYMKYRHVRIYIHSAYTHM